MPTPKLSLSEMRERARRTARGSTPPAGIDPEPGRAGPDSGRAGPDLRARTAIRQRLRRTRSVRRARVAELGMLAAEMSARGRWNDSLIDKWVRELDTANAELHGLDRALRGDGSLNDLVAAHIVAQCVACGRIGGTGDAFCTGCGRELAATARSAPARNEPSGDHTLAGQLTTIQPTA